MLERKQPGMNRNIPKRIFARGSYERDSYPRSTLNLRTSHIKMKREK